MEAIITTFFEALKAPFEYVLDPSKRIYWGYSLSSLLLALIIAKSSKVVSLSIYLKRLISADFWKQPTIIMDIKLLFTNSVIKAFLILPIVALPASITLTVAAMVELNLGPPNPTVLSRLTIGTMYTLTLFFVSDLSRYIVHRLFHQISFLWQFHKVHHSATSLSPLTLYRLHPVEILILELRRALVIGLTTGIFLYLFRHQFNGFDILGVNALGFVFNATGANLRHSNTWLSYGRWLEHIFISPAQHQIHHSSALEHQNKNMGSCLALWDWVGKTLYIPSKHTHLSYGLAPNTSNPHTRLRDALFTPILSILKPSKHLRASSSSPRTTQA